MLSAGEENLTWGVRACYLKTFDFLLTLSAFVYVECRGMLQYAILMEDILSWHSRRITINDNWILFSSFSFRGLVLCMLTHNIMAYQGLNRIELWLILLVIHVSSSTTNQIVHWEMAWIYVFKQLHICSFKSVDCGFGQQLKILLGIIKPTLKSVSLWI